MSSCTWAKWGNWAPNPWIFTLFLFFFLQDFSLHSCPACIEVVEQCLLMCFLSFSARSQGWWWCGGGCHVRTGGSSLLDFIRGCLWPGRDSGKHLNQEFRGWPDINHELVQSELGPSHLFVPGSPKFQYSSSQMCCTSVQQLWGWSWYRVCFSEMWWVNIWAPDRDPALAGTK